MDEFARSVFCTVAHVAVPAPLSDRTNWLVQLDPAYAVAVPFAEPKKSAFGIDETVRLVVEAVVEVIIVDDAYGIESAEFVGAENVTLPLA